MGRSFNIYVFVRVIFFISLNVWLNYTLYFKKNYLQLLQYFDTRQLGDKGGLLAEIWGIQVLRCLGATISGELL